MKLEMFFDCSSPWSYLGFERIMPLAESFGLTVEWHPVLVGGIFNAVNPGVEFNLFKEKFPPRKVDYHAKVMQDWADITGIKINFPPAGHPINSVKAMRACLVLQPIGHLIPFARACYQAYFRDELPLSENSVLLDICREVGVDGDWLLGQITQQDAKDALRAKVDEAIARGAFGVPTTFLGGTDMYFGVDSLQLVSARLEQWQATEAVGSSG
ncbi:2-hydroxychromene-2-carboxylate isomerase [Sphingobium sp. BS19]|uniref:2-hydroxychromene-2-carboxylate isomerase n=1 Tax=Sphingobium sp. BS19 TaxID=3018973 RepID=UPI0022ED72FA|nr:2-hydroxychromene-2-carboxylate isomerase [Sphingobium sp. BS19]GLI96675.1 2-hydroxychromene-2-carboxylate isomerase [Sphingobium sp. BS19]